MRIETPTALIQVDSARLSGNQDRALQNCFENMVNWLCEDYDVSRREAYLMMSVNSLVRVNVYQYVCGNFVCGVEFPNPSAEFAGKRIAPIICYEQFLIWPIFQSGIDAPEVMMATGNGWWTTGTHAERTA